MVTTIVSIIALAIFLVVMIPRSMRATKEQSKQIARLDRIIGKAESVAVRRYTAQNGVAPPQLTSVPAAGTPADQSSPRPA